MNNKAKIVFYSAIVLLILIMTIYISTYANHKRITEAIDNAPSLIQEENKEDIDIHDIGLTSLEVTNEIETLEEYPERVMITNLSALAETSIPTPAIYSLQEYLSMYLDYYWDNGTNYEGSILEDTVKDDYISPSFHVYIEEIDLDIECLYHPTREIFFLYSRLDE